MYRLIENHRVTTIIVKRREIKNYLKGQVKGKRESLL